MQANTGLIDRIIERAETDKTFRKQLKTNPKMAIESELGITVPAALSVKVIEEGQNEVHIVLPAEGTTRALNDAQLAGVAGGDSSTWGPNCSQC